MVENQEKNIVNKVIIVTGGSRGIGAEIVKTLAKEGYTVILNYNKSEECAKNVKNELAQLGITVDIFKADVSKPDEAINLVQYTLEKYKSSINITTPTNSTYKNSIDISGYVLSEAPSFSLDL